MPLNIDWQQILLHLFNFVVLFAILYFLLYKPVKDFMDKRVNHYKTIDDEARKRLEEAERIKEEHQLKVSNCEAEIAVKKEKAFEELELSLVSKKKEAEDEALKIITEAKAIAEKECQKILLQAQGEVTDMVTKAAEKMIFNGNSTDAFDQFLAVAQRGENNE